MNFNFKKYYGWEILKLVTENRIKIGRKIALLNRLDCWLNEKENEIYIYGGQGNGFVLEKKGVITKYMDKYDLCSDKKRFMILPEEIPLTTAMKENCKILLDFKYKVKYPYDSKFVTFSEAIEALEENYDASQVTDIIKNCTIYKFDELLERIDICE